MMMKWGRELTILAALALLAGYLSLTQPNFRDAFTLGTILTNAAYVGVVGIGMTMVIVAGQIDISVGSVLAVWALVAGTLARAGAPVVLVGLTSLVVGPGVGALHRRVIGHLGIPSVL